MWVSIGGALVTGCFDAHGSRMDGGTPIIGPPRDADVQLIDPEAGPGPFGTWYGCHPDALFVPVETPSGCVARELWGDELRVCEIDERGRVGGRPVTVVNIVGENLTVWFIALEVLCSDRGCVRVLTDGADGRSCECGAAEWISFDPPIDPGTVLTRVDVSRFVQAYSFVAGGDGVRFRVVACVDE